MLREREKEKKRGLVCVNKYIWETYTNRERASDRDNKDREKRERAIQL